MNMSKSLGAGTQKVQVTPHWNAIGGLVAIGVLYALLPDKVSIGPRWSLLAIEAVFIIPFVFAVINQTKHFASHAARWFPGFARDRHHRISYRHCAYDLDLKNTTQWVWVAIHRAAVIWMQHSHVRFMVLGNRWGRSGKTSTGRPSTV